MFIQDGSADRSEAYRLLADLFARPPEDDDLEVIRKDLELKSGETAVEILDEFNYLLRYPGGRLPPLESLSVGSGGTDVAGSVSDSYERAGLTIGGEFEAPPDHISLELLFISYLVETNNPGLIEKFLDEHIMNWVPYYCEELKRQARTLFYKELADITRNFLQNEYGSFG